MERGIWGCSMTDEVRIVGFRVLVDLHFVIAECASIWIRVREGMGLSVGVSWIEYVISVRKCVLLG